MSDSETKNPEHSPLQAKLLSEYFERCPAQGKTRALLMFLTYNPELRRRVQKASIAEIDAFARRVPDAKTIEDVFAPVHSDENEMTEESLSPEALELFLKAKSETLRRQLTRKFGCVSPDLLQRVQQASLAELNAFLDRILDARSIEEVFAPLP